MNTLLWIAQIILAGVFLFTGFSKIFAYGQVVKVVEARSKAGPIGMSRGQAVLVGLVEIAGARECWCRWTCGLHIFFCGWRRRDWRC
jgi:uncharacterized membrane protein YphA (DoxX/SURF4 family)